MDVVLPVREKRAGPATRIAQAVVLLAIIVVGIFYLFPRIFNLVATPYRLDNAVTYANRYNPRLFGVARVEAGETLPAFTALDQMDAAIKRVEGVDAHSAQQLSTLTGQIRGDLQPILNSAGSNVHALNASLNSLAGQINTLNPPAAGAANAVIADRATLAAILQNARATAAQVHKAREEAGSSAGNVSGH
jgi:hypothetical protein